MGEVPNYPYIALVTTVGIIIVSKTMGMAGPGIEPASGGATTQDLSPLFYQSPSHFDLYATL